VIFIMTIGLAYTSIQVEKMKQRVLVAEAKVIQLKQAVKWVSILEQILPELAKDELNLLDEQLRQKKQGG